MIILDVIDPWNLIDQFIKDHTRREPSAFYYRMVQDLNKHNIQLWEVDENNIPISEITDRELAIEFSVTRVNARLALVFANEQDETMFRLKYL